MVEHALTVYYRSRDNHWTWPSLAKQPRRQQAALSGGLSRVDGGRQAARPRGAETGRPPPASRAPGSTSPVSPTHPGRSPSPDTPDGVPCLHYTLTSIKDRLFCSEWLRETHGSRFRPCLHLRTINNSPSSLLQGGMQGEGGGCTSGWRGQWW